MRYINKRVETPEPAILRCRIVTLMAGAESIRDVIAFPKTQRGQCLLTEAPSPVDERQLRELGLRLRKKPIA